MTADVEAQTDYFGRMNRLEESAEQKEWFKAMPGKHRIEFLSEGTPYEQEFEKDGKLEVVQKLRFDVRVGGKELSLGVAEGKTIASFYGQLMLVAMKMKPTNTLKGKTITLLVTSDNRGRKNFTVLEACELQEVKDVDSVEVKV